MVDSAAKRTVYVVTTAAGQSFETMYEDTPFFLSIHRVNAITALSAVTRFRQSLLSGCFARGVQGSWIFFRDDFTSRLQCARILVTVCRTWFLIPDAFALVLWLKTGGAESFDDDHGIDDRVRPRHFGLKKASSVVPKDTFSSSVCLIVLMIDAAVTWKAVIRTYFATWWIYIPPRLAFTLNGKISVVVKESAKSLRHVALSGGMNVLMQHALKDRDFRPKMFSQPNEVSLFAANASVVWNFTSTVVDSFMPFGSDDPFVLFFVRTGLEADTKILDATLVIRPLCWLQACNSEQGPISVEYLMETHTSQLVVWMLAPVSLTLQVPWDRHCFYVTCPVRYTTANARDLFLLSCSLTKLLLAQPVLGSVPKNIQLLLLSRFKALSRAIAFKQLLGPC